MAKRRSCEMAKRTITLPLPHRFVTAAMILDPTQALSYAPGNA